MLNQLSNIEQPARATGADSEAVSAARRDQPEPVLRRYQAHAATIPSLIGHFDRDRLFTRRVSQTGEQRRGALANAVGRCHIDRQGMQRGFGLRQFSLTQVKQGELFLGQS